MRGRLAAAIVALMLLGATAPKDDIAQVQGVYREAFTNHMAEGEPYRSVDELGIERRGPHKAYVSVHLEFRNGHTCDFGETTAYADGVFSVTTDPQVVGGELCEFKLTVLPDVLKISTTGDGCFAYCGMRGKLDGAQFKRSGRRPLRMARPRRER